MLRPSFCKQVRLPLARDCTFHPRISFLTFGQADNLAEAHVINLSRGLLCPGGAVVVYVFMAARLLRGLEPTQLHADAAYQGWSQISKQWIGRPIRQVRSILMIGSPLCVQSGLNKKVLARLCLLAVAYAQPQDPCSYRALSYTVDESEQKSLLALLQSS